MSDKQHGAIVIVGPGGLVREERPDLRVVYLALAPEFRVILADAGEILYLIKVRATDRQDMVFVPIVSRRIRVCPNVVGFMYQRYGIIIT